MINSERQRTLKDTDRTTSTHTSTQTICPIYGPKRDEKEGRRIVVRDGGSGVGVESVCFSDGEDAEVKEGFVVEDNVF